MPLFLSASSLLPIRALNLAPPAPPPRRCLLPAPLAASASSSRPPPRQPYRRRRYAPARTPSSPPPPTPTPPRQQQQPQQRPVNAPARGPRDARGQEELEAAIYDFMRRSAKPGAFPTREELIAAGRADLAAAVAASGGWLSLGWSSSPAADGPSTRTPVSSGGGHPDYPPESGLYDRNLAPGAANDGGRDQEKEEEEEPSPSGRQPETEEPREVRFKSGIEGMLTRLQRERERARPPQRSRDGAGGRGDNGGMCGFFITQNSPGA